MCRFPFRWFAAVVVAVVAASCTSAGDRADQALGVDTTMPPPTSSPARPQAAISTFPTPRAALVADPGAVAGPPAVPAGDEEAELRSRQDAASETVDPGDGVVTRTADAASWMLLANDVIRLRSTNPLRASRAWAGVAVAMHDAVQGAAALGRVDQRQPPHEVDASLDRSGDVPVGAWAVQVPRGELVPHVVAAGAAHTVLTKLFPAERGRLDAAARRSRAVAALTGQAWPSTIDGSWSFGEAIGTQVAARLAADGAAQAPTSGTPPPGSSWVPTPPLFAPANEPSGGSLRPWILARGDELRPPAPPAPGSPELTSAARDVWQTSQSLTDRDRKQIESWAYGAGTDTPPGAWIRIAANAVDQAQMTTSDSTLVLATLAMAEADAGIAVWDAKYHYGLVRPITVVQSGIDKNWAPSLVTPNHPSYPSGHSAFSGAAWRVLGAFFPERSDEFRRSAAEAGDSRVLGGIHYWFDNRAGLELGEEIAARAIARTQGGLEVPTGSAVELARHASLTPPPTS